MIWTDLSTIEQMANIGSEVSRTINWKNKDKQDAEMAFYRALDLLEKTIADPKNGPRLKEICRVKETLVDWYLDDGLYQSFDKQWQDYFNQFNYAARINR